MLLQHQGVGELLVAHRTLMQHADGRLGTVDAHMRPKVAFGCERTATDLTFEWAFSGVRAVVHLQS